MPLPLLPIISALAAGGTLVPHAAGGMIVTSAAGYVAGTYLSTSAIGGLVVGATATAGAGLALAFGTMKGVIGTVVARAAAPLIVTTTAITAPVASTSALSFLGGPVGILLTVFSALGIVYGVYRISMLKRKSNHVPKGKEAQFSETEANIVEQIIKRLAEKESLIDEA